MTSRIGLAQCGFPADGDASAQVERFAVEAEARGVDLLVFPEDLMSPHPLDPAGLRQIAEPLDGPFVSSLAATASRHNLWMAFTLYESRGPELQPYNTAVLLDADGNTRTVYRKCHLYDAHGVRESERTGRGEELCTPVATPFGKLGLGICYDLRFPEVTRAAALAGCEVMLFPSAWHDGLEKLSHWETLLRARAIENEVFVVGVCKAGERYVGRSLVADPLGRVLVRASGKGDELLVCDADTGAIEMAREAMPLLAHRRPELY